MKAVTTVLLAATICSGLFAIGCQTSHSESDKPGLFGGHKHEETTVYKNNDGTTSVEQEKKTTNR